VHFHYPIIVRQRKRDDIFQFVFEDNLLKFYLMLIEFDLFNYILFIVCINLWKYQ